MGTKKKESEVDIKALALIGARVRRDELRTALADAEQTIRMLQQVTKAAPLRKARAKRTRTRYNAKFKSDVVAEAKASGVASAAKKYGVRANQIYRWRKG